MAGSHEVRGSIPLGSTKLSSPPYGGLFLSMLQVHKMTHYLVF